MKFRDDVYKQNRGTSHFLDIHCQTCNTHICYYQKDGAGSLRRMYLDRIVNNNFTDQTLKCKKCNEILGTRIIYVKENRPAYRLYVDAVTTKIIPAKLIKQSDNY